MGKWDKVLGHSMAVMIQKIMNIGLVTLQPIWNYIPNSPGYRLILNNILFPAAKKKKRKT